MVAQKAEAFTRANNKITTPSFSRTQAKLKKQHAPVATSLRFRGVEGTNLRPYSTDANPKWALFRISLQFAPLLSLSAATTQLQRKNLHPIHRPLAIGTSFLSRPRFNRRGVANRVVRAWSCCQSDA
mmetsp:Transcript_1066/g.1999  ORF Transcript_1066/g.1999 Transcript_1066/m.1999 type:complete len:127 (-) Transcript_1066:167-547(-)|eukprot:scaffold86255_cov31-Tisochrysis_lutea.AAC.4